MRKQLIGVAVALLVTMAPAPEAQTNPARRLLETARKIEMVDGDLSGAIAKYQEIVDHYGKSDRAAAAHALVRIGECYRTLGDGRAETMFERVIREYGDQADAVRLARGRLAPAPVRPSDSAQAPRLVCEKCGDPYASISADGRTMALVDQSMSDVVLHELASGKLTRLLLGGEGPEAGNALFATLAPDSGQIAYAWKPEREKFAQLRVVASSAGARPRVLVSNPEFTYVLPAAWAPDGRWIVAWTAKSDRTWQLHRVSAVDGAVTTLKSLNWRINAPIHISSVSPDGKYIAYSALSVSPAKPGRPEVTDRHIYVLAADGSSESTLVGGAAINDVPIWTPDGAHVVYTSNVSGTTDLWAVPVLNGRATGTPVLLRKNAGEIVSIGMTKSGVYHFYEGRAGIIRTEIARVNVGTAPEQLAPVIGSLPSWSPDGSSLALLRPRGSGGGMDVVIRSTQDGAERVYSRPGIPNLPALWFANGKALLTVVTEGPESFWTRIDTDTAEFTKLVKERADADRLTHRNIKTLAPDGRTLYLGTYANNADPQIDRIVALDLTTGAYRDVFKLPFQLASLPSAAQHMTMAISPDGTLLAMQLYDPQSERGRLTTVRVDGTGYREVIPDVKGAYLRNKLAWSRDGRFIYYTEAGEKDDQGEDKHRVMRVAMSGGDPEFAGLEIAGLNGFDVGQDVRIAYSTLRPEGWGQLLWTLDVASILGTRRSNGSASRE